MTILCPCQSGKQYQDCCGVFHNHQQIPENSELLMRSRYSAFAIKNLDYIVETTLPKQQSKLDIQLLKKWLSSTEWHGLEIIEHVDEITPQHSSVEFRAYYIQDDKLQVHHEKSLFVKVNCRWYFADPTVDLPKMNKPCICGSGKTFEICCGEMLCQFYLVT